MPYPFLQWSLWVAGAGLQVLITFLLIHRGLQRAYPTLCFMFAWKSVGTFFAMYAMTRSLQVYADTYWTLRVVGWVLLLLVILELYGITLRRYRGLRSIVRAAVLSSGVALLVVSCATVILGGSGVDEPYQWINNWFYVLMRAATIVHLGLLLTLAALVGYFGLAIPTLARFVMLGLLIYTALSATLAGLRVETGSVSYLVLAIAQPVAESVFFFALIAGILRTSLAAEQAELPVLAVNDARHEILLTHLEGLNLALSRALRQ